MLTPEFSILIALWGRKLTLYKTTQRIWRLNLSPVTGATLYRAFHSLEEKGLVKTENGLRSLSEEGKEYLIDKLDELDITLVEIKNGTKTNSG